jgi:hypothetical protein
MRRGYLASAAVLALATCVALAGCGGAASFGDSMICTSDTSCTVSMTNPAGNSDILQWAITSSDGRVVITPAHGTIAPGQTMIAAVTLPAGVCPIELDGHASGGLWPFMESFGWAGDITKRDSNGACHAAGVPLS